MSRPDWSSGLERVTTDPWGAGRQPLLWYLPDFHPTTEGQQGNYEQATEYIRIHVDHRKISVRDHRLPTLDTYPIDDRGSENKQNDILNRLFQIEGGIPETASKRAIRQKVPPLVKQVWRYWVRDDRLRRCVENRVIEDDTSYQSDSCPAKSARNDWNTNRRHLSNSGRPSYLKLPTQSEEGKLADRGRSLYTNTDGNGGSR